MESFLVDLMVDCLVDCWDNLQAVERDFVVVVEKDFRVGRLKVA